MEMSDLSSRALAAYFRSAANDGAIVQQPSTPKEHEVGGKRYVVLSNAGGVLAVYRVRIVNGQEVLKGLKRWPAELNEI